MNILGINAYHADSSAALLIDGRLIVAVEEERLRRVKHWAGFPEHAIRCCLKHAGLRVDQLDVVAVNQDSGANLWRKIAFALTRGPDFGLLADRVKNRRQRADIETEIEKLFPEQRFKGTIFPVEHHLAHLSSAYHVAPFNKALIVSLDGFGDFAGCSWAIGQDAEIKVAGKIYFPHSLGIFYQALTQYLGFPQYGDEYKVMGLAAFGKPEYLDAMRRLVILRDNGEFRLNGQYFRHHRKRVDHTGDNGAPAIGKLYSRQLTRLLGPAREPTERLGQKHMDLARSVQEMYEEAFFNLLNALHRSHNIDDLALAGGCAMNSVANGKIRDRTPFKRIYIQPAAGDAGGALGAAFVARHHFDATNDTFVMEHCYWGPEFTGATIDLLLEEKRQELRATGCVVSPSQSPEDLCRETAAAIAAGKIAGWFQGRMEWGARALGNRSILCDPRRATQRDILNQKIKRRESFRPFAASILEEQFANWFEQDDDTPFMMKVFQVRREKRAAIPAVTHVDGSSRPQTVSSGSNPLFYRLIQVFNDITGVPLVLNTSFNENEPMVCRPREALACFLRSQMDILALGDRIIKKS